MKTEKQGDCKTKILYRCYMVWQDEEEEIWLRNMSLQGWHLVSVSCGMKYRFIKGEPKNYYYRLDYINPFKSDKGEYINLFREMGWLYIGDVFNGWQYFRTENEAGIDNVTEIYTDKSSKIEKNMKILRVLAVVFFINLITGVPNLIVRLWSSGNVNDHHLFVSGLNIGCVALLGYAMLKIMKRIKLLKSKIC